MAGLTLAGLPQWSRNRGEGKDDTKPVAGAIRKAITSARIVGLPWLADDAGGPVLSRLCLQDISD